METRLGKIQKANFGFGGYQEAMIGISFTLGNDGWGVQDFWGEWGIKRSEHAKWTEEDRVVKLGQMTMRLAGVLKDAKVETVSQLEGMPIEVTFEGNALSSWRILKEVL